MRAAVFMRPGVGDPPLIHPGGKVGGGGRGCSRTLSDSFLRTSEKVLFLFFFCYTTSFLLWYLQTRSAEFDPTLVFFFPLSEPLDLSGTNQTPPSFPQPPPPPPPSHRSTASLTIRATKVPTKRKSQQLGNSEAGVLKWRVTNRQWASEPVSQWVSLINSVHRPAPLQWPPCVIACKNAEGEQSGGQILCWWLTSVSHQTAERWINSASASKRFSSPEMIWMFSCFAPLFFFFI